jgi:hypothetical protein
MIPPETTKIGAGTKKRMNCRFPADPIVSPISADGDAREIDRKITNVPGDFLYAVLRRLANLFALN